MSQVAEQLQAVRKARKLTVQQVADATKIRTDHIRALEEGNFKVFPAPVYLRGAVKIYSTLLKLDVPQIMAMLDAESGRAEKAVPQPPAPAAETATTLDGVLFLLSKFDWRKAAIGGAAIGLLLIVSLVGMALRHHSRATPLAGLKPGVYQSADSGETLPLPHR